MKKIQAYVISHGHMDIEWYQPLRSYRFWQVEALDRLIGLAEADPNLTPYTIDGQVFPLLEYLEVRPEKAEIMRKLVKDGKLNIGPFFTQFDEWLPSGEAMARNCLYGQRLAAPFGGAMRMGYLPDNFGHPKQLPQILNNFGIDSLVFARGMPYIAEDFPDEFSYVGLDGSKLLAINFRDTYCGTYNPGAPVEPMARIDTPYYKGYLSYEHHTAVSDIADPAITAEQLIERARRLLKFVPSGAVAIVVGADHTPPQRGLTGALKIANESQDEIEFIAASPDDYIAAVKVGNTNPPDVTEELIGSRFQFILLGALSTRAYLKRENFAAEALLEKYAEPIEAMARRLGGQDWGQLLDESWRLLMTNHAHDSIHGSSVDEVHVEMMQRNYAAEQNGAGIVFDSMRAIGRQVKPWWPEGAQGLLAYTPTHSARTLHTVWVNHPQGPLEAVDSQGNRYPVQIVEPPAPEENGRGEQRNPIEMPHPLVQAIFSAPGDCGQFKTFALTASEGLEAAPMLSGDGFIENEHLRVDFEGAVMRVSDKATGRAYHDLNLLVEEADAGDYWDSSTTWQPSEVVLSNRFPATIRLSERGAVRSTMEVSGALSVPQKLIGDMRSPERVDIPYRLEVSLVAGARRADVKLWFDNRAEDHRLRLRFAPGIQGSEVRSGAAFGQMQRPIAPAKPAGKCAQPHTLVYPMREWVALHDERGGMAVVIKGVYDYEPFADSYTGEAGVYLTLLRSVGNMTRQNMRARKHCAAWSLSSKSAQCPGEQMIEFSYVPFGEAEDFLPEVSAFLYPAHVQRIMPEDGVAGIPSGEFEWDAPNLVFSARKKAYDGDGEILRFFENEGKQTCAAIDLGLWREAWMSNMNEEGLHRLDVVDGKVVLDVGPWKVITLKLVK